MAQHSRRAFIQAAGLGAASLAAGPALHGTRASGQGEKGDPNVLVIICDQLNASCLSCYGGPVPTPHIDRLASDGVRFGQATCPTPFCSPSRASMVNGLHPHAHGIVANCGARQQGLTPEDVTTERILSEAGYQTNHYGKWHLHGKDLPYYPDMFRPIDYQHDMAETFDRVRAESPNGFMPFYAWALPVEVDPAFQKAVDGLGDKWKDQRYAGFITKMGRLLLPLEDHYDVRAANLTVDRLRNLDERPFMLTCSFIAPHDPNIVPSPYYEMFGPASLELPANWQNTEEAFEGNWSRRIIADLGEAGLREFLRVYYAMVKLIDDQVGRIMEALEATGRADDTVVIFTSDHGDMMGGHGMVWKSTACFFDEVARIPLIYNYPGRIAPRESDIAACLTDTMPTLFDFMGRPTPEGTQGQSLAPYLRGERDDSEARAYSFSERVPVHPEAKREVQPGTRGNFMVRGQGWKYARYGGGAEFLYNLAEDPGETANLAADKGYTDRKSELQTEMDRWLTETGFPMEAE